VRGEREAGDDDDASLSFTMSFSMNELSMIELLKSFLK
jgi:hypothetical protein